MNKVFTLLFLLLPSLAQATLIPVKEIFTEPTFYEVDLSPSGEVFAAYTFEEGVGYIVVYDTKTLKPYKKLRFGSKDRIKSVSWIDSDSLFISFTSGDKSRIGLVNFDAADLDKQSDYHQINHKGYLINTLPNKKDTVLFAKKNGDGDDVELAVYEVSTKELLETPKSETKFKNAKSPITHKNGALLYHYDARTSTYFSVTVDREEQTITIWFQRKGSNNWKEMLTWDDFDTKLDPIAMIDDNHVLVLSNSTTDRVAAAKFNIKTKQIEQILYQHPQYDLTAASLNEEGTDLGIVAYVQNGKVKKELLKNSDSHLSSRIKDLFPKKEVIVSDYSNDLSQIVAYVYATNDSGSYYLIDGKAFTAQKIAPHYTYSKEHEFASTKAFTLNTPDGDAIEAYYTPAIENRNNVLLVMPHGGPIGIRDYSHFDESVQYFANRGFSVLRVNFRGSTGFGKSFQKKGVGEFGKLIEKDIKLAFDHISKKYGYKQACTIGSSYGGYSALMLPILYPHSFDCAVGIFGVYDLPLLFNESNTRIKEEYRSSISKIVGDYSEELIEVSPVYRAQELNLPILLISGAKDKTARPEHTDRMTLVLNKLRKDVQHIKYKNARHGHAFWSEDRHEHILVDEFIRKKLHLPNIDGPENKNVLNSEMALVADGYRNGFVEGDNSGKAVDYYNRAAVLGNSRAMYNMGVYYEEGRAVFKNIDTAMEWYQKSATAGFVRANFKLGNLWSTGENGTIDLKKSHEYYTKAHNAGFDSRAGIKVAEGFCLGNGVDKDFPKCLHLLALETWKQDADRNLKNEVVNVSFEPRNEIITQLLLDEDLSSEEFNQVITLLEENRKISFRPMTFHLNNEGIFDFKDKKYQHEETKFTLPVDWHARFGVRYNLDIERNDTEESVGVLIRWTRTTKESGKPEVVYTALDSRSRSQNWNSIYRLDSNELFPAEYVVEIFTLDKKLLYKREFTVVE